jgi:hypothetical protein
MAEHSTSTANSSATFELNLASLPLHVVWRWPPAQTVLGKKEERLYSQCCICKVVQGERPHPSSYCVCSHAKMRFVRGKLRMRQKHRLEGPPSTTSLYHARLVRVGSTDQGFPGRVYKPWPLNGSTSLTTGYSGRSCHC